MKVIIRRGHIGSHDCTRIADPVRKRDAIAIRRIYIAEYPVFPHKAVGMVL